MTNQPYDYPNAGPLDLDMLQRLGALMGAKSVLENEPPERGGMAKSLLGPGGGPAVLPERFGPIHLVDLADYIYAGIHPLSGPVGEMTEDEQEAFLAEVAEERDAG